MFETLVLKMLVPFLCGIVVGNAIGNLLIKPIGSTKIVEVIKIILGLALMALLLLL